MPSVIEHDINKQPFLYINRQQSLLQQLSLAGTCCRQTLTALHIETTELDACDIYREKGC